MDLERASIEKRDFPQARRGYEPEAVDAHLRAIADAVEQLKSAQPQSSLAGTAASRVESIVAAAEASAREIEEKARAEADATRAQAKRDAAERAQAIVDRVTTRLGALQEELAKALAGLDDRPAPATESEPKPKPKPAAAPEREPEPEPEPEPQAAPEPASEAKPAAPEGARLVALNMALSGTPRDETARYLRENFELDNAEALLDDVYARAGS
jgi:DivIVA domain-containing protein